MVDDVEKPSGSGPGGRPWHGHSSDSTSANVPGSRQRFWFMLLTGALLVLLSLALAWSLHIKPPAAAPFFLTINIGDYNARHYPIRPFASQDNALLLDYFPAISRQQAVTNSKVLLREQLKGFKDRSVQPLIVHITALALVRDETVYLLPGDADPDDESTWLDVREVIDALKDCPAKGMLVILDLCHPLVDPRLGVLTDRVANTMEEYLRKEEPPFYVLCPCSGDQYSLTSEVLQCSVLANYLDQGLQGHADAKKTGSITVLELCEFVKARVNRWAQINRGVRQEPRLLGKGLDFTVAHVNGRGSATDRPKLEGYPEALTKAWQDRDDALDMGAFRWAPRHLQKLEANLLRQEKLRQRGSAPMKVLDEESRKLAHELLTAVTIRSAPPWSLALALSGAKEPPGLADALLQSLTKEADGKTGPDEMLKSVQAELVKQLKAEKNADFPQQAAALAEALGRIKQLKPSHVQAAHEALTAMKAPQRFAEVLFLARIAEFAKEAYPDQWPGEKIKVAWQTMQNHQNVLAALDQEPEFFAWVGSDIDEADRRRRLGERKLLRERPSQWEDAVKDLQAATTIYAQTTKTLAMLQACRRALDRSFGLLPAFLELLCNWPEADDDAEQAWFQAAEEATTLRAYFSDPPKLGATRPGNMLTDARVNIHGGKLKDHLDDLEAVLQRRISGAEKGDTAKAMQQLCCLLDSPLLKSQKRAELVDRQRKLAMNLQELTDKLDEKDNQTRLQQQYADAALKGPERKSGLVRAKMSLALLGLAGVDPGEKKWDLPLEKKQLDRRDEARLELALHELWGRDLPNRWRQAKPDHRADALNRVVSPWDWTDKVSAADGDVSLLLQKELRKSYLGWLITRYKLEGGALQASPSERLARDYYFDVAEKLQRYVADLK